MEPKPTNGVPTHDPVVLFDGVCPLCNGAVQFILRRDGRNQFRFAPLQSQFGHQFLSTQGLPSDTFDTLVLVEGPRYFTKSTAALRIARRLDGLWPLLSVLAVVPVQARDHVYDFVAAHRYRWFGRYDTCMVPRPTWSNRFLD